jgi:GntR family transcriptional regulator
MPINCVVFAKGRIGGREPYSNAAYHLRCMVRPRPQKTVDARPLSDQARETLLTAIRDGRFPGGRLPPEAGLAEMIGVSRTTLRAALQSLSAEGVISRRRRRGTFVNDHVLRSTMQLNRLIPFTALVEQSGFRATTDPHTKRVAAADPELADHLQIASGAAILIVRRLLRADGRPVIAITDVIPVEELTVDPGRVSDAPSTFAFLQINAGAVIDYATSEIVPRVATGTEPEELELAAGTPYIELREIHFSADHERIALSMVSVVDAMVRLSLLRRGQ